MLRSARYGLPPPPVPRIHAPIARDSISAAETGRSGAIGAYVILPAFRRTSRSAGLEVGHDYHATGWETPRDDAGGARRHRARRGVRARGRQEDPRVRGAARSEEHTS